MWTTGGTPPKALPSLSLECWRRRIQQIRIPGAIRIPGLSRILGLFRGLE